MTSERATEILHEVIRGQGINTSDTTDEAVYRNRLVTEVHAIKDQGGVVDIVFEWPDVDTSKKFNPYHDEKGLFTTKDSVSSGVDVANKAQIEEAIGTAQNGLKASIKPSHVKGFLETAADVDTDFDLTNVSVAGTTLFGDNGLGIPRIDMPQIPGVNRDGFLQSLKEANVDYSQEHVSPLNLYPSQGEIAARKTGQMYKNAKVVLEDKSPLFISNDNYVLDGHHRWAIAAALNLDDPTIKLRTTRIMLPHQQALKMMLEYGEKHGIARRTLSDAKKRELLRKYGYDVATSYTEVFKANPYHDEEGKFTTKGDALSYTRLKERDFKVSRVEAAIVMKRTVTAQKALDILNETIQAEELSFGEDIKIINETLGILRKRIIPRALLQVQDNDDDVLD